MVKVKEKQHTVIKTWDGDIYVIKDMTPKQVHEYVKELDTIEMPDGTFLSKGAIEKIQPMKTYEWQAEAKTRHKMGQYLRGDRWRSMHGDEAPAQIGTITGELLLDKPKKK